MLTITIPSCELFNEYTNEIKHTKETTIQLEHSLVSLSKWESKFKKPFISNEPKTNEETLEYVKCMTITQNVDPDIYNYLTMDNMKDIQEYIQSPMTATIIKSNRLNSSWEQITSELIYYWMIAQEIPMECQRWHLNRLLTLIQLCSIKNDPKQNKSMSKSEILKQNAAINAQRRAAAARVHKPHI